MFITRARRIKNGWIVTDENYVEKFMGTCEFTTLLNQMERERPTPKIVNKITPADLNTQDLERIKEVAMDYADTPGTNPFWQRAYLRLADAADHLDAMRKRSIVKE